MYNRFNLILVTTILVRSSLCWIQYKLDLRWDIVYYQEKRFWHESLEAGATLATAGNTGKRVERLTCGVRFNIFEVSIKSLTLSRERTPVA